MDGAEGRSHIVVLNIAERFDGLGYGSARPHRRAGQGKGRQGPRRYGPIGFRRDPAAVGPCAAEKALSFEIKVPNAETRAAMAELERGGGASFDSVADLMAELNAKD